MEKQLLRKVYKQKRKELSKAEFDVYQEEIFNQVKMVDFSKIGNIHIFLPIQKQIEVNTYPIVKYLWSINKTVIISKSDFTDNSLTHYKYTKETILKENAYGIPEPINAEAFDVKKIDMVFVPLLISDKNNYRVGYGKGFYDRFLSNCKKEIKTIGLNFFKPIKEIVDKNKYDVPLEMVIYPKK